MTHVRIKLTIAGLVLVVAVLCLAMAGVRKGWTYYLPVDEFAASDEYQDRRVRLAGTVDEQNVTASPARLTASFDLIGGGARLPVVYSGVIPEMFEPGREVVVEGRLDETGVFQADVMLTKCASKYSSDDHAARLGNDP